METPYIGGVYYATPLAVSHLGEEEEEGDIAAAFGSPLVLGASRGRKRILAEEIDEEEDEEELIMPHSSRRRPQAVSRSAAGSAPTGDPHGTFYASAPAGSKATSAANLSRHSVVVVKSCH